MATEPKNKSETSKESDEELKKREKEENETCADPNQAPLTTEDPHDTENDVDQMEAATWRCLPPFCPPGGRSKVFKWKIEGISLLLSQEPPRASCFSGEFHCQGYTWQLEFRVDKRNEGGSYVSLFLNLASFSDDLVVMPKYKLLIYNLLDSKRTIQLKGGNTPFCKASRTWGFPSDTFNLSLDKFKSPQAGFVVNDSCVLGAKMTKVTVLQLNEGVSQCFSVKKIDSKNAFALKIDEFSVLEAGSILQSLTFSINGFTWNLKLYPKGDGRRNNNYMSLYLYLHPPSNLLTSPVYVEFILNAKGQSGTSLLSKPKVGRHCFSSQAYSWGWPSFMAIGHDPRPTVFEVVITKIGVSNNPTRKSD